MRKYKTQSGQIVFFMDDFPYFIDKNTYFFQLFAILFFYLKIQVKEVSKAKS